MKRLGGTPKSKRAFSCPQCDKKNLIRDLDHVVSADQREYKTRDNTTVKLFVDICDKCKAKNWRKHFEPTKSDVKRVLKAMQEEAKLSEESLEDLL